MFTRFPLSAGILCLAFGAAGAGNAQSYSCPGFGNVDVRITFIEGTDAAIAEFIATGTATEAADPVTMRAEPGGDGLTYTGNTLVLRADGDSGELTVGDATRPCGPAGVEEASAPVEDPIEQTPEIIEEPEVDEAPVEEVIEAEPAEEVIQEALPEVPAAPLEEVAPEAPTTQTVAAISLGGNLRSGPGTDFEDIGGLDEGAEITLLADTGVPLNGYNWWEIALPNGSTAFQWGGVICVPGGGVAGVIEDATLCQPEAPSTETLTIVGEPTPDGALAAVSLGGNLRSGPGTAFPDIGDAAPGTEITLLSDSGIPFDGYNWWQVELPNGEVAFQWGGVICVPSGAVAGLLESCP